MTADPITKPSTPAKLRAHGVIPKIYHMADKIDQEGRVSALCFKRPRAIDMKKMRWTLREEAVTCPGCIAALRARGIE